MFNKKRILTAAICATALLGGTYSAMSVAATANGTATAIVIAPLTIVQGVNGLDFSTVSPGASGGTVEVTAAGAVTLTGTATQTGVVSAGDFDISGQAAQAYTLSFGAGIISDGTNTMAVTPNTDNSLGAIPVSTTETFQVGSILTVGAGQIAGTYDEAQAGGSPYTVTINY